MTDGVIAGFWRRTIAFVIDTCILGVTGWVVGYLLFAFLVAHPYWARLLGYLISMSYFVALEGLALCGQSLGKRCLRVYVVGEDGQQLSLIATISRYTIAAVPYFLNGVFLPLAPGLLAGVVGIAMTFLVFGVGLTQIYLYLFNRKTGQSLADLITHAVVLRIPPAITEKNVTSHPLIAEPVQSARRPRLARVHAWVGLVILVVPTLAIGIFWAVGASRVSASVTDGTGVTADMIQTVWHQEQQLPAVVSATLTVNRTAIIGTQGSTSNVVVQSSLSITDDPNQSEALLRRAARLILEGMPQIPSDAMITVVVVRGFDMGISSAWVRKGYRNTVEATRRWLDSGLNNDLNRS
jgi:uncharacterized RDD family membrane protein YckC